MRLMNSLPQNTLLCTLIGLCLLTACTTQPHQSTTSRTDNATSAHKMNPSSTTGGVGLVPTTVALTAVDIQSNAPTKESTASAAPSLPQAQIASPLHDEDTGSKMGKALISPLFDLNLAKQDIPELLKQAKENPYKMPSPSSCDNIKTEIEQLTLILGVDVDYLYKDEKGNIINKGVEQLGNVAINSIKGITEAIPFRTWLRKLSGADRRAKEASAAAIAGVMRRSYLKGIYKAQSCMPEYPLPLSSNPVGGKP